MTTEVEKLSQAAVDEAVTLGQYIAEDPERLKAWLDAYGQDDALAARLFALLGSMRLKAEREAGE